MNRRATARPIPFAAPVTTATGADSLILDLQIRNRPVRAIDARQAAVAAGRVAR
jgi:hypothetical protein